MFVFIGRFLKGLILGWIISLVMYLAKRALARAFGQMQQPQQPRSNPQPAEGNDIVETMWAGMSIDQLRATFGTPQSKQATASGDIWVYANLNGQGTETSITITNGVVTSWQNAPSEKKAISA